MKRFWQNGRQSGGNVIGKIWRATLGRGRRPQGDLGHDGAWRSRIGRRQSQAGFNLIEVSLAVAICAIGLIALVGLLPTGIDASRRAADDSLITSMANDLMHWRRITPYLYPTVYPTSSPAMTTPSVSTITADGMGNYGNATENFYTPYFLITETVTANPMMPTDNNSARLVLTIQWPLRGNSGTTATSANLMPNYSTRIFISDFTRMQ